MSGRVAAALRLTEGVREYRWWDRPVSHWCIWAPGRLSPDEDVQCTVQYRRSVRRRLAFWLWLGYCEVIYKAAALAAHAQRTVLGCG